MMMHLKGLRQIIKRQGFTNQELAESTGLTTSYISRLCCLTGQTTPKTAQKIATALSCDVVDLVKAPNINDTLTGLLDEVRLYRRFMSAVYEELGVKLPDIT